MLVDTHCHLADDAFAEDRPEVMARAAQAGVRHVVVVGDCVETSERAADLASADACLSATAGIHPHEASTWNADVEARLRELLDRPQVVAVGETGLDYHYDHSSRPAQRTAFAAQLELGAIVGKPVVVHSREADGDLIAILRDAPSETVCIMHSFSGGRELLDAALARHSYISFSGMVTFKHWKGDAWVRAVPPDRLLVETDAPYLAPVPHRGHRNEPQHVWVVAKRVAEIRDVSAEVLAHATTTNAVRCLGSRVGRSGETD